MFRLLVSPLNGKRIYHCLNTEFARVWNVNFQAGHYCDEVGLSEALIASKLIGKGHFAEMGATEKYPMKSGMFFSISKNSSNFHAMKLNTSATSVWLCTYLHINSMNHFHHESSCTRFP